MNSSLSENEMERRFLHSLDGIGLCQDSLNARCPFLGTRMREAVQKITGQCNGLSSEASLHVVEGVEAILGCLSARVSEVGVLTTLLTDGTCVPVESHFLAVNHPVMNEAPSQLAENLIELLPPWWQKKLEDREFWLAVQRKQILRSAEASLNESL